MMRIRPWWIGAALALAGCGGGGGNASANAAGNNAGAAEANAAAPAAANAAGPAPSEEAAIMAAAGFTRRGEEWRNPGCSDASGEVAEMRDLNGDGRREALVQTDGDQCYGHNQRQLLIFTQAGTGGWRQLAEFQHRFLGYEFRPRPGLAWPDVEVFDAMLASGDEPLGCVPFYRWNGRDYVDGGTSNNGRICTLAAGAPSAAGDAPAAATRPVPPLNVAAGYYVGEGTPCSAPIEAIFYDGRRLAYMVGETSGAETVRPIGPVRRRGAFFVFADHDMAIRVLGPNRIQAEIQDTGPPMRLCPAAQMPAAMRVR
ncbi:MAG TPA: hypothetical protein VMG08_16885 [Allosphingosinicella sp.]|nr:hypothetical protein [Allosphingosinicella sp.]